MKTYNFLKAALKHLKTTGTVTRSSQFVCRKMVDFIDFDKARVIVELGAGDGVITQHILRKMHPDCKLIAFEVLDELLPLLRQYEGDKRLIIAHDSAENIAEYLKKIGVSHIDYAVSALPFSILPDALGNSIVQEAYKYMRTGGLFIQLQYSLFSKKLYEKIFGNVDVNFVPINIPPAFVIVSEKMR